LQVCNHKAEQSQGLIDKLGIEIEVEKIGLLRNEVVDEPAS
jgi:hypothetical protein